MRPQYGNSLGFERILNVYFYTSNPDKLLQARLMFVRHGYLLRHFKGDREPYDEDYSLPTEHMLSRAIQQVNAEFGVRSIFFVEDTSLRLEALSDSSDFPGLKVKEWFASSPFEGVDRLIQERGGDRRAVVKSDIALYVPTLSQIMFFHGETAGTVVPSQPGFSGSTQYPWLTPTTFNGWFIPDGATKRLGEMEFEESLEFDFRAKSLTKLIARLEEMNAALNLGASFYTVRRPEILHPPEQLAFRELLPREESEPQILLIIGHKCAGKTTLSDYLASRDDVMVLEASSVLRQLASDAGKSVDTAEDAFDFLRERGLDCVADAIARYLERGKAHLNVVTGLRTVEEIFLLAQRFPRARIVFIDSDARTRFERHLRRSRDTDVRSFREFEKQDEKQATFGALRVATEIATETIRNDGTLEQYRARIDAVVSAPLQHALAPQQKSELHRTLIALDAIGDAGTCEQISSRAVALGVPVRKYNTNRALKAVPEFAERVKRSGHLLRYKLTARGQRLLELLNLIAGSRPAKTDIGEGKAGHHDTSYTADQQ
jgi:inosine/xanthosine triphosphate pyrophosphatase family protein/dephospho-CoA kinase